MSAFLLYLVLTLIVVGVLLWAVSVIPMDPTIKQIIRVLVIVFVVIWLIYMLVGILPPMPYPHR